jgi:hypothetical protein
MKKYAVLLAFILLIWSGCSKDKNPVNTKTHPDTWMQTQSADFHGQKVIAIGPSSCASCHGEDFTGGESGVSCYRCHASYPHVPEWGHSGNLQLHGQAVSSLGWRMDGCKKCHGEDYSGGLVKKSCLACHTKTGGPEACNVCHGNENNYAPPKDLQGHMEQSYMGVGRHQTHVNSFKNCTVCHVMPATFADPAHIDGTPNAEVNANLKWDRTTGTCTAICHRNPDESYVWNGM